MFYILQLTSDAPIFFITGECLFTGACAKKHGNIGSWYKTMAHQMSTLCNCITT